MKLAVLCGVSCNCFVARPVRLREESMARPPCPLCSDRFSVVRISRLYHAQCAVPETESAEQPLLWKLLAPPRLPALPGQYLGLAAIAGLVLWLVSGFTLLCLALPLCIGAGIEALVHGDRVQELDAYRRARGVWRAAYYCTTHDRVFLPDE